MNSKLYPTLATLAIAVAGAITLTSAFAVEATQFEPQAGTKTRAEVKADKADSGVVQYGEATVFVDKPSVGLPATALASGTGLPFTSDVKVVRLGEATQFVDQPGTFSRAQVRAETLAAIRGARHQ